MTEHTRYGGPMRFAHRGVAQVAPENTLGAFQAAVDSRYEGIEIDIQRAKDGEIIVAHDANFTRMTLGHPTGFSNRRICDMTWEEIRAVELPFANHLLPSELPPHSEIEELLVVPMLLMGQISDRDYEAALKEDDRMARLMRFEDFDAWLSEQTYKPVVEIEVKSSGMMPEMHRILEHSENVNNYILFSGVRAYNEEIQETFSGSQTINGLRLGANIRFLNDETKAWIAQATLFEVGLNAETFDENDLAWLRSRGVAALSNLGDYPAWWEKLQTLDVMGFKTNYPQAYTAWRERRT